MESLIKQREMNKKGNIDWPQIVFGVIGFVILVVALGTGANVLDALQNQQTEGSAAFNATQDGLEGINTFSSQTGTLATIAVMVVIVGALIGVWALFFRGR